MIKFSNKDKSVFVIDGDAEEKAALMARFARTKHPIREVYTREFEANKDRAPDFLAKIFGEFGDDSVAQLTTVSMGFDSMSNILTKLVERPRLGAYCEKSTRAIVFSQVRPVTPPELVGTSLERPYEALMQHMMTNYNTQIHVKRKELATKYEGEFGHLPTFKNAVKEAALDHAREELPCSIPSSLGMTASVQTWERLVMRLFATPLKEAQDLADEILQELEAEVPTLIHRVRREDRGQVWIEYMKEKEPTYHIGGYRGKEHVKMAPSPKMTTATALWLSYMAESRKDRRHQYPREVEGLLYGFDVTSSYSAFRDLQRHRMCKIEHGVVYPYGTQLDDETLRVYYAMKEEHGPVVAQYCLPMKCLIDYDILTNLREAVHMIELRSRKHGHHKYRKVVISMMNQMVEEAGTPRGVFKFADETPFYPLPRL